VTGADVATTVQVLAASFVTVVVKVTPLALVAEPVVLLPPDVDESSVAEPVVATWTLLLSNTRTLLFSTLHLNVVVAVQTFFESGPVNPIAQVPSAA
jgi:hypothetical protein